MIANLRAAAASFPTYTDHEVGISVEYALGSRCSP